LADERPSVLNSSSVSNGGASGRESYTFVMNDGWLAFVKRLQANGY
jgi:hypothetical protein